MERMLGAVKDDEDYIFVDAMKRARRAILLGFAEKGASAEGLSQGILPLRGPLLRTISTTANIYTHLEADSKLEAANALNNVFGFAEEKHVG